MANEQSSVDAPEAASAMAEQASHPNQPAVGTAGHAVKPAARHRGRIIAIGAVVLLLILAIGVPVIRHALSTVSTDDAYVNSHVTFVAPRVAGQVMKVFVDDNNQVRKGDLIVQLDKEPYEVSLRLKQAAVDVAKADLIAAQDQVRAMAAQVRANRFKLQRSMEDVNNQIAMLAANVATWESRKATLDRAKADLDRQRPLLEKGIVTRQDFDRYQEEFRVGEASVKQALEQVHQVRVALGLPPEPPDGKPYTDVPADLDQNFSTVRQALGDLLVSAAPLGIFPPSYDSTPKQIVEAFLKRDPQGNLDRIYEELIKNAAIAKQAETKLAQAERELDQAKLNLRYCDVLAEIDGVVTRRNVNPGNNVQIGQSLMAVRSLTEIWIDANFKETQLRNLRIGQRAELEVDMYGRRKKFEGRITGFTMGTGSTLALLPAQNATGNFIKVVQRLPVRIEPVNYDPSDVPLFVGLSVVPHVFIHEKPTGPDAGKFLQPYPVTAERATDAGKPAAGHPTSVASPADQKDTAQGTKP